MNSDPEDFRLILGAGGSIFSPSSRLEFTGQSISTKSVQISQQEGVCNHGISSWIKVQLRWPLS